MQLYRITKDESDYGVWAGTLADAHEALKARKHGQDPYIDLIDVPTDKAGILALLNDDGFAYISKLPRMRSWALTDRGGLREEKEV